MPSLDRPSGVCNNRNVKKRPWIRWPRSKTELNSRRLRIRRSLGNVGDELPAFRVSRSSGDATRGWGLIVSIRSSTEAVDGPTIAAVSCTWPAGLRGGNRQPLAALGAATLQDVPPVLRGHADQEAVSAAPAAAIGLKRAFALHDARNPCKLRIMAEKTSIVANQPRECQSNGSRAWEVWLSFRGYVRVASLRQP